MPPLLQPGTTAHFQLLALPTSPQCRPSFSHTHTPPATQLLHLGLLFLLTQSNVCYCPSRLRRKAIPLPGLTSLIEFIYAEDAEQFRGTGYAHTQETARHTQIEKKSVEACVGSFRYIAPQIPPLSCLPWAALAGAPAGLVWPREGMRDGWDGGQRWRELLPCFDPRPMPGLVSCPVTRFQSPFPHTPTSQWLLH